MSISSSLAHKYDEFDEFPQQSAPKSAYEALKEWADKYKVGYVEWESEWTGNPCISFHHSEENFVFTKDGAFIDIE